METSVRTKTGENDFFLETGGTVELDAIRGGTGQISSFEENNKSISQSDNSFDNFFFNVLCERSTNRNQDSLMGPCILTRQCLIKKKNGETSKI